MLFDDLQLVGLDALRSPGETVHPAENFVWLIVEFNGARSACDRRRDLEHLVEDALCELRLCKIRCTILDRSSTNPSGHIEADFLDLRYVQLGRASCRARVCQKM